MMNLWFLEFECSVRAELLIILYSTKTIHRQQMEKSSLFVWRQSYRAATFNGNPWLTLCLPTSHCPSFFLATKSDILQSLLQSFWESVCSVQSSWGRCWGNRVSSRPHSVCRGELWITGHCFSYPLRKTGGLW